MEGHVALVQSDGWKVDDVVVTVVERTILPGPVSLVDEHHHPGALPGAPTTGTTPSKSRPTTTPKSPAAERQLSPTHAAINWLQEKIGWSGIIAIVFLVLVGFGVRETYQKKRPAR